MEGDRTTKKEIHASQMASGIYIVIPVALLAILGIFIYLAYLYRKRNCYSDFHIIANGNEFLLKVFAICTFYFTSDLISFLGEAKRKSIRQSEILGLMVEKRHSDQSTGDTAEEKRPVWMKRILEDKIKPVKEEFAELNDLDRRKNWPRFTKAIGEIHNSIVSSDGQIKCLNR